MPYKKVGKNKYKRKDKKDGKTYTLQQIQAIHINKKKRGK